MKAQFKTDGGSHEGRVERSSDLRGGPGPFERRWRAFRQAAMSLGLYDPAIEMAARMAFHAGAADALALLVKARLDPTAVDALAEEIARGACS